MNKIDNTNIESAAQRIAKNLQRNFDEAHRLGLVVMASGDGGTLNVYAESDYYIGTPDTCYGLSIDGSFLEPLACINSRAIKY